MEPIYSMNHNLQVVVQHLTSLNHMEQMIQTPQHNTPRSIIWLMAPDNTKEVIGGEFYSSNFIDDFRNESFKSGATWLH